MDSYYNLDWFLYHAYNGSWNFFGQRFKGNDAGAITTFQQYQPFKVFGSFGNDYINLFLGRYRQSMGDGITGNLVIGDNFSKQDMLRLSATSKYFNYTYSYTHFDTQYNDVDRASDSDYPDYKDFAFDKVTFNGKHSVRVFHRFELNAFERVRLSAMQGAMFYIDAPLDIRLLNPMMVVHSFFNNNEDAILKPDSHDESNNMFAFEVEYAFLPGWLMSAQFALDQAQVAGETSGSLPMAYGLLGNIRNTTPISGGILDTWAEGVYTSPYLYLDDKYEPVVNGDKIEKGSRNYNYDYIVGYQLSRASEIGYSGYPAGPDAIVLDLGAKYTVPHSWAISLDSMLLLKGEKGFHWWNTSADQDSAHLYDDESLFGRNSPTGTVWTSWTLTLGAQYSILENLRVTAKVSSICNWNYHHEKDAYRYRMQAVVGLVWNAL